MADVVSPAGANATADPPPAITASFGPRHVERALAYLAALKGDDPQRAASADRESRRWRDRDARHEAAWTDALRRWDAVQRLSPLLRETLVPAPGITAPSRRRALQTGGTGIVAGLSGWLGWRWWQAPTFERQFIALRAQNVSGVGLPDGSLLDLAADSTVQVALWRDRREVRLAHGRVHFDVAHDASRPFTVVTRLGRVEVLGTAFTVVDRGQGLQVDVERGSVRVVVSGRSAPAPLQAGEAARIDEDGVLAAATSSAGRHDAAAWRTGWWRFVDTPLADAVAEVNASLRAPLEVQADAGRLRITGSFRIDRPSVFIDSLPRVLPVRVVSVGGPAGNAAGQRVELRR